MSQRNKIKKFYFILPFIIASMMGISTYIFASGANDDPSGASSMSVNGSGTGNVNYDGDPVDWWVVTVSAVGELKFTLDVPSGQDFELEIYNTTAPNGWLGGSYNGAGSDEEVTVPMTYSGPYYAKVYTYGSSSGSYTIYNEVIPLNTVPQTPDPSSPVDNEVITDLTPTLSWSSFQDGGDGNSQNGYQVRVRCDTDGDAIVYDTGYISSSSSHSHTYDPGAYSGYDSISGCTRVSDYLEWAKHYHWHVRYRDSSGDWGGWSGDTSSTHQDFYTNSDPEVDITSPSDGDTVSGTVTITVDGWDDEDGALDEIEYYIDGTKKHTDDSPLPQCPSSEWDWDTTSYSNGWHTIKVVGYDFNGWIDVDEIDVEVANNQDPTLSNGRVTPESGDITTDFTFYVTYADADGDAPNVKTVNIDGSGGDYTHDMTYVSGNYTAGALYKYETTLDVAEHSFYFYFTDGEGGSAMTDVIGGPSVTNQPPEATIDSPSNNETVSGTVEISVTAIDLEDLGVSKVEYYIDDVLKYTDDSPLAQCPSSTWDWDTTSYTDDTHTIKVLAWDSDDSSGEDSISVTVQNNRDPLLSNGHVTPESGNITTDFTFYVTYADADGDAPNVKTVNIDGSGGDYTHDMTYVSGNYTAGALYKYETTLDVAEHSFYFYFTDGEGGSAMTDVIGGPSVTNQPPEATIDSPSNNETVSGTVEISVTAIDLEDLGVSKVEYYIDDVLKYTDNSPVAQSPSSSWDWDTTLYTDDTHTIKVLAWDSDDVSGEDSIAVTVDNSTVLLDIDSFWIDDDSNGGSNGNGDGNPDPGESIELHVLLENTGYGVANGVNAVLASLNSDIVVTDSYETYGDIAPEETKDCVHDFDFDIPSDCSGTPQFELEIHWNGDTESTVENIVLSDVHSDGTINITALNQSGLSIYPGSVYVNDALSGDLDSNGKFTLMDLDIGCYSIRVTDEKGQTSATQNVDIHADGDVKEASLTVYQTLFFDIDVPSGLVLGSGTTKDINIDIAIEACEAGNLYAYLYDDSMNQIDTDSVYLNYSGSYFEELTLSLVAPEIEDSYQYIVKGVFDPDDPTVNNTIIEKTLLFNVSQSAGLIEWVKIKNSSGQELDHELYKFEVCDYQIQVKTSESSAVMWGERTFDIMSSTNNIYYYDLRYADLIWGEWDEDIPGTINNITIEAASATATESKTISLESRDTTTDETSYHFAQFTEAFNAVNEVGHINLAQNILDRKSTLVSTQKWQEVGQFDWVGETVTIKMKVGVTRDTGKYSWEVFFSRPSEHLHYSIVNGDKVHMSGSLPGGVRWSRPTRNYFYDDLVEVEVAGDGRIYRALYKKDLYPYDVPDFDPRFIKTRPTPAEFNTLEDAVDDAANFFETYKNWKISKQSLSGGFKVGIHNRLKTVSRWGRYIRWAGWIVEGVIYVWEVNDILQAAHGDKFEQIVEVTGETVGCIGAGTALAYGGAKVGLLCGPKAWICSPALFIGGGIVGCIGGMWGGEKISRYAYRTFIEGQEVDWEDLDNEVYYYLTQFCDQISPTPEEDYRCYYEDGSSFIVTKFDRQGPDAYVTYDEPGGQLPEQQDVPIILIGENDLYTKTYKGNWVRMKRTGDHSYIRTSEQPSEVSKIVYYDLNTIEIAGISGGEAKALIVIKNIRDIEDVYIIDLDTSGLPGGWSASVDEDSVVIGSKDAYAVLVTVNIWSLAKEEDAASVFITATAQGDNSIANTMELVTRVDSSMPFVDLNNLQNDQVVSGNYDVHGTIADVSPSIVNINIDGTAVGTQLPYTWDTNLVLPTQGGSSIIHPESTAFKAEAYFNKSLGMSTDGDVAQSNDGIHTLEIVATDFAGNSTSTQLSVSVDNPPVITIALPEDNEIFSSSNTDIIGTIHDPGIVSADIIINGIANPLTLSVGHFNAPVALIPGLNNVKVTASDNSGNVSQKSIVVKLNSQPALDTLSDVSSPENTLIEFQVNASDPDEDLLIFNASNLPSGAEFNVETKIFTWIPAYGQAGEYPDVHFEVTDGLLSDSEDITITVNDVDITPPETADDYDGLWHDEDFTISLAATDTQSSVIDTYYKINE
ncbi:Ig-like domain-containing protein, partial [Candidatus Omnitrophota bacterium]